MRGVRRADCAASPCCRAAGRFAAPCCCARDPGGVARAGGARRLSRRVRRSAQWAHNPEEHGECVWLCVGPVEPVEADRRLGEAYVGGRVKGECPPVCVASCGSTSDAPDTVPVPCSSLISHCALWKPLWPGPCCRRPPGSGSEEGPLAKIVSIEITHRGAS